MDNRPKVNYRWRFGQKYSRSLGNIYAKSGKGEITACSFSAEAERHSLKRSSSVTSDWTTQLAFVRFKPYVVTNVR